MTQELSALPESFPAGTTVRYRKRFADYPASEGWTLKLYLAGASVLAKTAAADGNDFIVTLEAADTPAPFIPGVYKWVERVSNEAGEVYEVGSGAVTVTPDVSEATDGSEQDFSERAVALLKAHIEGRLPAGMESFQIAGRVVSKIPVKEAVELLRHFEGRLAHLASPDFVTRPVLVSFTGPGFDQ